MGYLVYWCDSEYNWHYEHFASLTEATIRKTELKQQGIIARVVGARTPIVEGGNVV